MKKFAGFTPQQQYTLLSKQGYNGPADEASMAKFLAASPAAASKMGEYAQIAQQRLAGKPMPTQAMAVGGTVYQPDKVASDFADRPMSVGAPPPPPKATPPASEPSGLEAFASQPAPPVIKTSATNRPGDGLVSKENFDADFYLKTYPQIAASGVDPWTHYQNYGRKAGRYPNATYGQPAPTPATPPAPSATDKLMQASVKDPMSIVTKPEVEKIKTSPDQFIPEDKVELSGVPEVTATTVEDTSTVTAPEPIKPATVTAETIGGKTPQADVIKGTVSDESLVKAETMDPKDLAALDVETPQITDPTQVIPPPPREIQPGEIISGSEVDMAKVNEAIDFKAAQANPSKMATVQGQLEGLMNQFEGGETPAWAAGAIRQATSTLISRGLGASSLAGQAVIQAAMESALPIAEIDAKVRADFELQNLSNRQATAVFAAEQRAKFLEIEFDQNFRAKVENAAKIADIANTNFTAEVQIALENAQLVQSTNLANLDVSKARMISKMAALTQVDVANLNNRQQAAVENARAFLQMDMTNLDNEQQATIFNTKARLDALISDQAAENAAKQFNASSENQNNQFFAELTSNIARFNAEQENAINQFNAGEANAAKQFNAKMKAQREEFNANNSLIIAQANAVWRQNINTLDTAAQNEANIVTAKVASGFTASTIDQIWQRERDIMNAALTTAEGDANRAVSLMLADKELDLAKFEQGVADTRSRNTLLVELVSDFFKDDWF